MVVSDDARDVLEQVYGRVWCSGEVCENFKMLCREFGGRFSGSSDERSAAEFISGRLETYGLSSVHRDWFDIPVWNRGDISFAVTSPRFIALPAQALPYAPSCDGEWEVTDLGKEKPPAMGEIEGSVTGRAVMVQDGSLPGEPPLHRLQKYVMVRKGGAAAFIFAHNTPGMLMPTGSLAYNHSLGPEQVIPSVGIAYETYEYLRLLSRSGPLRIRLKMHNELYPGKSCNVVADLTGEAYPEEIILVGAHYDGHDIAQGAMDNASGAAVVMEAAGVAASLGRPLKRTIRFVLFGSEEMGMLGSYYLARKCRAEQVRIRLVVNVDCVGNSGCLSAMLQHSPGFRGIMRAWADDVEDAVEVVDYLVPFSDHFPFLLQGVPGVFLTTPGTGGRGWGHTSADTFEKVSCGTLRRHAAHLTRLLIKLGNADNLPSGSIDMELLRETIRERRLELLLAYEGHSIPSSSG